MNCPHCGYEERTFNNKSCEYEYNEAYGRFFTMNRVAERTLNCLGDVDTRGIYGCPKCTLLFMSDY